MKKVILKTVILTLTSLIAVFLIAYGCVAGSSPKTLAGIWSDFGSYDISIKYYEKQYEKTQDIFDLVALCNKVNEQSDSARAERSLRLLTENEKFSDVCEKEDKNVGYSFTAYEFYFGKYVVSSYFESGIDSALAVAEKSVSAGYTKHSAYYSLLGIESLTKSDGTAIKESIEKIKSSLNGEEQQLAERDIKLADSIK